MFNNKSLPSKIYSYGGKAPTEGLEAVENQMRLAHAYKNTIVEIERTRRGKTEALLLSLSPELLDLDKKVSGLKAEKEALRDEIKQARAAARKRIKCPELETRVKLVKAELKELYPKLKALKKSIYASATWKTDSEAIETEAKAARLKLRADTDLYWGSYLHVESSLAKIRSGAPPNFHRFDGGGHLAVQIQGGLSPEEASSGKDTRIRITEYPKGLFIPGKRQPRKLGNATLHFRIGSEGRAPVWAVIPFTLHRPLDPDSQIKWVHLIRYRIGTHFKWNVQFVLSKKSWARPDVSKTGSLGLNVGWRMKDSGELRVAYWTGSDGRHEELALPAKWLAGMRKTEDIRSIRDKLFDTVRESFAKWLSSISIPEWLKTATEFLPQWKAQKRLAYVSILWRTQRFAGDEEQFQAIEAWRQRDKHLYCYEANLRDQLQGERTSIYRNFAAAMRRTYQTAILGEMHLPDFHKLPKAEQPAAEAMIKEHIRDACVSELNKCLKESMSKTIKAPSQNITKKCHSCASIEEWDHKILVHTCSKCGITYDQDFCAATNLLRSQEDPGLTGPSAGAGPSVKPGDPESKVA